MDTITHTTRKGTSEFGLTNTNKLIKQYQWATGLKTGSTSKAGRCLSATALKDNIELIAVVMTAPDSKSRFADAVSLLNYGFSSCFSYGDEEDITIPDQEITGGVKGTVRCKAKDSFHYMFLEKPDTAKIERRMVRSSAPRTLWPFRNQDTSDLESFTHGRPWVNKRFCHKIQYFSLIFAQVLYTPESNVELWEKG